MATVFASSPPQPISKPSASFPSPTPPSPRLSAPLRRSRNHLSQPLHSSPDWSFEQRIQESLSILDLMESQSISPDPTLFSTLLKSCAAARNLRFGRLVHHRILLSGLHTDPFVANNLICFYSRCGLLDTARKLFDEMPLRNVVSWTTAISMYHHAGFPRDALDLYRSMRTTDSAIRPNAFTYTIVLNSCASVGDLETGIRVHEETMTDECDGDEFVVVALIDMYGKCGRVSDARRVFDKIPNPSPEACTAIIEGYHGDGEAKEAMCLIRRVLRAGPVAEIACQLGFTTIIKPCIMEMALRQGQEVHAHIIKLGHKPGIKALNSLVELYEKCDKVVIARRLFDGLAAKDLRLWSRIMYGFVRDGLYVEALEVFVDMAWSDTGLNPFVVASALKACVGMLGLEEGKQIHGRVIKVCNLLEDSVIGDLAELYSSCGEHEEACKLRKLQRN